VELTGHAANRMLATTAGTSMLSTLRIFMTSPSMVIV
jgi:hypothetical protein